MTTSPAPSRAALVDLVRDALGIVCGRDESSIVPATSLADLGVDSLGRVSLAEIVEERLESQAPGLHIPDGALTDFDTVDDVVRYLESAL